MPISQNSYYIELWEMLFLKITKSPYQLSIRTILIFYTILDSSTPLIRVLLRIPFRIFLAIF